MRGKRFALLSIAMFVAIMLGFVFWPTQNESECYACVDITSTGDGLPLASTVLVGYPMDLCCLVNQHQCCCGGGGGPGGGGDDGGGETEDSGDPGDTCNETPTGPSIYNFQYEPPYPIVAGQDPQRRGFTFTVKARAGHDECGNPFTLTDLAADLELKSSSVNWIRGDLAKRYPGAYLKGYVVLDQRVDLSAGTLKMHVLPFDPGIWRVTITAVQSNGWSATRTFEVPVYLLEGTLGEP